MLEQELEVGIAALQTATRIARHVQREITPGTRDKEDRSPVTVADLAVQAVISRTLHTHFPHDPLMGEEGIEELGRADWAELLAQVVSQVQQVSGHDRPGSAEVLSWIERGQQAIDPQRRYWVLDPVDGTKGFLRKGQYAIALSLIERGEILLGLLACPNLPSRLEQGMSLDIDPQFGQIYCAVRGGGAKMLPIPATGELQPAQAISVCADGPPELLQWCERVETSARNKDVTGQIAELAGIVQPPFRIDSQAKYAVVARGNAALYLRHTLDPAYREKVWDHAAGVLIMQEAGGTVTDLYGRPLDFSRGRELSENRGIVATHGPIHGRVLEAVSRILAQVEGRGPQS